MWENPHKDCYHWYASIRMRQKHYKQLLKETRHVKEVFDTLKNFFYEAINHQEDKREEDQEHRKITKSIVEYRDMDVEEARYIDESLTILEMFREDEALNNQTRQRRFIAELGSLLVGAGVYANYKNIQKIKENIEVLHEENRKQNEAIGVLAKFLKIVDTRVRIHTRMLNNINVALTQLQYRLIYLTHLSI